MEQLAFLRRLIALSTAGLTYAHDVFDQERYQAIHELAVTQLTTLTDEPVGLVHELFSGETGYPTPKVDVRAFITDANRVLLVEDAQGEWALPGGFAEVGWSLRENVAKEVKEETGQQVAVGALRAIYDTARRPDIPRGFQYYKAIFACTIETGRFEQNSETVKTAWFDQEHLPRLSTKRTTPEQLRQLFDFDSVYIE